MYYVTSLYTVMYIVLLCVSAEHAQSSLPRVYRYGETIWRMAMFNDRICKLSKMIDLLYNNRCPVTFKMRYRSTFLVAGRRYRDLR